MPLSQKESKKLITDLAKYIEEEQWTKQNIGKLEKAGKITKEDADFLRKKQSQANRKRDKLEDEIAKVVVARFPSRFGKPRTEKKEEEAKPKEVIVPKEEPAIIEIPKTVLERINSGIETQAAYFSSYEETAKAQLEAFNTIKEIAEEDRAIRENYSEITYPAGGGEVLIPAGETVLDIWTGDVYLGDGTSGILSDSLSRLGQLYARSIYVDTKKSFSVQLDGKAKHTVAADDFFARKGIQCQRVSIEVTEATSLKFWASTNPDAALEETRRAVITGEDTWYYRTYDNISTGMYTQVAIYNVPTNKRLKVETISITCAKSCIQILELCVSTSGATDYWRRRQYDVQGTFNFTNVILNAGETLKIRYHNLAGETLLFNLELLGMLGTV